MHRRRWAVELFSTFGNSFRLSAFDVPSGSTTYGKGLAKRSGTPENRAGHDRASRSKSVENEGTRGDGALSSFALDEERQSPNPKQGHTEAKAC